MKIDLESDLPCNVPVGYKPIGVICTEGLPPRALARCAESGALVAVLGGAPMELDQDEAEKALAAAYEVETAAMDLMFARIEAEDAQIAADEMQQAAARASLTAEVRQLSRAEISCKLPEWVAEVFRAYGCGNLSKGLRQGARLINLHRKRIEAGFK